MAGSEDLTLGIDLGGTKMALAHVDSAGRILDLWSMPRPATAEAMDIMPVEAARSMLIPRVKAIGIGAAGLVRADEGVLVWGPNVEGHEVRFSEIFEAELGLPTVVDNDAQPGRSGGGPDRVGPRVPARVHDHVGNRDRRLLGDRWRAV